MCERTRPRRRGGRLACYCGLTLIELLIVMAIIGTLVGIALPLYADVTERARIIKAIADIRTLEIEIAGFEATTQALPDDLADIGRDTLKDPWNRPYQYRNFTNTPPGQRRKDRFLVPLNTKYDLYSMGKDGQSQPPLTAKASQDDIVRANDGSFIGLGSRY